MMTSNCYIFGCNGILKGKKCFIGAGVVVNLHSLIKEIEAVQQQGIKIDSSLLHIADNATIIIDGYKKIDAAMEALLTDNKIGTTKKGIGIQKKDNSLQVTARDCLFFMLGQHIARLSAKKRINLLKKPKI